MTISTQFEFVLYAHGNAAILPIFVRTATRKCDVRIHWIAGTVWESQMLDDFRDNTPPTVEIGSGTKIGAAIAVLVAIGAIGVAAWQYGGKSQMPVTAAATQAATPAPIASAEQSTAAPDTSTATAETAPTTDAAPQGYPLAAQPPAATPTATPVPKPAASPNVRFAARAQPAPAAPRAAQEQAPVAETNAAPAVSAPPAEPAAPAATPPAEAPAQAAAPERPAEAPPAQ